MGAAASTAGRAQRAAPAAGRQGKQGGGFDQARLAAPSERGSLARARGAPVAGRWRPQPWAARACPAPAPAPGSAGSAGRGGRVVGQLPPHLPVHSGRRRQPGAAIGGQVRAHLPGQHGADLPAPPRGPPPPPWRRRRLPPACVSAPSRCRRRRQRPRTLWLAAAGRQPSERMVLGCAAALLSARRAWLAAHLARPGRARCCCCCCCCWPWPPSLQRGPAPLPVQGGAPKAGSGASRRWGSRWDARWRRTVSGRGGGGNGDTSDAVRCARRVDQRCSSLTAREPLQA
jgi:hypothetical protein